MLSKRIKRIVTIILATVLLVFLAIVCCVHNLSDLELNISVQNQQTVEAFSTFTPPEATAEFSVFGLKFSPKVKVQETVDTTKLGDYFITYKTQFFFKTKVEQLRITVADTTPPVISCQEENIRLFGGKTTITPEEIKLNYTAIDSLDGDLTKNVQISVQDLTCILSVADKSGNIATKKINIIPDDKEYPTLVLSKASTYFLKVNSTYIEPGFSAKDNIDGDITGKVKVKSNVDTSKSGEYTVEYEVSDRAGNKTKMVRKVIVYGSLNSESFQNVTPNGKTVYLTFDDGPGAYTQEVLNHLDRYGVKATFFVTNQFTRYQNLLKTIDQKGHTIGIHTATHSWSIYKSEENFYNDFNQMQSIIKAQTGKETNIFRFPGGTNNTISKSNKGIMTRLSKELLSQGYVYFDWNVDCNDARTRSTQEIISSTINQISNRQNAVVLMHDIKKHTVDAVPAIIEYCLKNGYTFAPLSKDSPEVRFKPAN